MVSEIEKSLFVFVGTFLVFLSIRLEQKKQDFLKRFLSSNVPESRNLLSCRVSKYLVLYNSVKVEIGS